MSNEKRKEVAFILRFFLPRESEQQWLVSNSSFSTVYGRVLGDLQLKRKAWGEEQSHERGTQQTKLFYSWIVGDGSVGHRSDYASAQSTLVNMFQLLGGKNRKMQKYLDLSS